MEFIDEIENEIENLKENEYGLIVTKTKNKGVITTNIIIPQDILNKEVSDEQIEFKLIIDTYSLKLSPKLYCVTPYCVPHLADGRDLYKELRNSKNQNRGLDFTNLLSDILEFVKINFERGGLIFCGNYYLGAKYDLRILQKGCENIINVKENLTVNGKNVKYNRVLVLSDVYCLLFQQEKWYKNNLTLLFWGSINNIEKIQKVKDNKTLILHWTQKDRENPYLMSLTIPQRDSFIQDLLEKMRVFGMNYDIMKVNEGNKIENKRYSSTSKDQKKEEGGENSKSQNELIGKSNNKIKNEDKKEEEADEEEDEEEEKNEEEKNKDKVNNNNNKNDNEENNEKIKEENNNDNNKKNENDSKNKNNDDIEEKLDEDEINIDINIAKKD